MYIVNLAVRDNIYVFVQCFIPTKCTAHKVSIPQLVAELDETVNHFPSLTTCVFIFTFFKQECI